MCSMIVWPSGATCSRSRRVSPQPLAPTGNAGRNPGVGKVEDPEWVQILNGSVARTLPVRPTVVFGGKGDLTVIAAMPKAAGGSMTRAAGDSVTAMPGAMYRVVTGVPGGMTLLVVAGIVTVRAGPHLLVLARAAGGACFDASGDLDRLPGLIDDLHAAVRPVGGCETGAPGGTVKPGTADDGEPFLPGMVTKFRISVVCVAVRFRSGVPSVVDKFRAVGTFVPEVGGGEPGAVSGIDAAMYASMEDFDLDRSLRHGGDRIHFDVRSAGAGLTGLTAFRSGHLGRELRRDGLGDHGLGHERRARKLGGLQGTGREVHGGRRGRG